MTDATEKAAQQPRVLAGEFQPSVDETTSPKSNARVIKSFTERVADLAAYKERHGHLRVTAKEDKSLYEFCRNIRQKRKGRGKGKLTDDRIASLNALGFDWGSSVTSFSDRLAELAAYKERHGHLNVSKKEDQSIYNFCRDIRQARKGKGNLKLTDERKASLDAMGFDWQVNKSFSDRLADLAAYKERHGHLNVTKKEDKSLYMFCCNIRRARKGKGEAKLTDDRIASLDALDFDWRLASTSINSQTKEDDSVDENDQKGGHPVKMGKGTPLMPGQPSETASTRNGETDNDDSDDEELGAYIWRNSSTGRAAMAAAETLCTL